MERNQELMKSCQRYGNDTEKSWLDTDLSRWKPFQSCCVLEEYTCTARQSNISIKNGFRRHNKGDKKEIKKHPKPLEENELTKSRLEKVDGAYKKMTTEYKRALKELGQMKEHSEMIKIENVALKKLIEFKNIREWKTTPFQCQKCDFGCETETYLTEHLQTHKNDLNNKCKNCEFVGDTESWLNEHIKLHEKELQIKCQHGVIICKTKSQLSEHIKIHKTPNFLCEQCEFSCKSQTHLNNHIKLQTTLQIKCRVCKCIFKSENYLNKHKSTEHSWHKAHVHILLILMTFKASAGIKRVSTDHFNPHS